MINITGLLGTIETIKSCTDNDINTHFDTIQKYVEGKDRQVFINRMTQAVDENTAYMSSKGCFLYYLKSTDKTSEGVALSSHNNPESMIALFTGVFTMIEPTMMRMNFHLHSCKTINEYRSLVTLVSIKRQVIAGYPLTVDIDKLRQKINNLLVLRCQK